MLHIELVPHDVKVLAEEVTKVTIIIRADLTSGIVKTAEEYASTIVPEIDPLYKAVLALCDTVIKACTAIQSFDWSGVEARLSRLVAEITALKHGNQHGIGKYCTWAQIVIDFIIGKDATATPA